MKQQKAFGRFLFPISLALLMAACSQDSGKTPDTWQPVAPLVGADADITRLSQTEMNAARERLGRQVNLEPAEGLRVNLWAPEKLLADPVAISVDYQGRVWTAVTRRYGHSEFDIRAYPEWEIPSMHFMTVEDRRAFLREELSPDNSDANQWLEDINRDGSHDWRDLTVKKEQVVLLEDTDGSGWANQSRLFLQDFHTEVTEILAGLYYHNERDELFLGVIPNAWRVKDTSGDLHADIKQPLSEGFGVHIGFGGHSMSGMTLGPDGRIYYAIGDIGAHITDVDGNQYPLPNQGLIVRSEPDGSNFEVYARGLRNTHEFTFDQYGNLITVDNDGDHDGEYERVVYLIDGSDSGWRISWQLGKYRDPKNNNYKVWMDENYYTPRFADQAAHILPPIAPYHAGPTGMVYNPGTALSEQWQNHFFVVEFVGSAPRAGINAFTLEPKGASFELSSDQNILRGVLATGLDFGPDGALYIADWIEGWGTKGEGRIWKLDVAEGVDRALRQSTQSLLAADFTELSVEALKEHLSHADMRVRQRAQLQLGERGEQAALLAVAQGSEQQLARIHAIWGLGQLARRGAASLAPLEPLLMDDDPEIRAQVARVMGDVAHTEAREPLVALLRDKSLRVRLFAVQALGRIGQPEAQDAIVAMLEDNNDEDVYLRHAGAIALARIGDSETLAQLHRHSSQAVRVAAVVALMRLQSPELARFLDDDSEYVVTNAARAITDDHYAEAALPALAALLASTEFTNEPLLRRAINANLHLGGEAAAERLLQFALRADIPDHLRAEALDSLAVWTESSPFDRVAGRYRGVVSHPVEQASDRLAALSDQLLGDSSPQVRASTISALAALGISGATELLVDALQTDNSPRVRAAALQALFDLHYPQMGRAALTATNDRDSQVRMAALALLPKLDVPTEEVVELHRVLLEQGSAFEQQAAYRSLANVDHPGARDLLGDSLRQLRDGSLPAELQLDVIEAVKTLGEESLLAELEAYESAKDPDRPMEVYREALKGGDPDNGMMLFRYDSSAQCLRCHMVGHRGAKVGPNLTFIGRELTRRELLEALVDPGARVPPGYGRVSVALSDGRQVSGFFEAETRDTMTIVDEGETVQVAKADVVEKEYSGSGMPPMGHLLSRSQLRDIVAYMATLPTEEDLQGHEH